MSAAPLPARRVRVVVYLYPFDKSPSLQNLVEDLARTHDVCALVDARYAGALPPELAARVHAPAVRAAAPAAAGTPRGWLERLARGLPGPLRRLARDVFIARQLLGPLPRFRRLLRAHLQAGDVVIAADKASLFAVLASGRVPQLYYSLEATPLREEDSLTYALLNVLETVYVRFARPRVIAQSVARASLVQPDRGRHIIVPVTSGGGPVPRSDFLRRHLGLAPEQKIVLVAGGLGRDHMTDQVVAQARYWDKGLVLVVHPASGPAPPEVRAAVEAAGGRIRLTDLRLTIEEAERQVYASADIGIVYYRDGGFNLRHTAHSSGKLAAFLRAGVPVIVPPFDEFRAVLQRFAFGEAADVGRIEECAQKILARPDVYTAQARAAFDEIYAYRRYAGLVGQVVDAQCGER